MTGSGLKSRSRRRIRKSLRPRTLEDSRAGLMTWIRNRSPRKLGRTICFSMIGRAHAFSISSAASRSLDAYPFQRLVDAIHGVDVRRMLAGFKTTDRLSAYAG